MSSTSCAQSRGGLTVTHYTDTLSLDVQVLFSGPATDLFLFVEEVEYTPKNGQQQDADDDDCYDRSSAL